MRERCEVGEDAGDEVLEALGAGKGFAALEGQVEGGALAEGHEGFSAGEVQGAVCG